MSASYKVTCKKKHKGDMLVVPHLRNARTTHTHTHPFNGPFSETTRVSWYQKGKTNLDFTEARDSEWQWHQLSLMQVCTSRQTDNHASTPLLNVNGRTNERIMCAKKLTVSQFNRAHRSGQLKQ